VRTFCSYLKYAVAAEVIVAVAIEDISVRNDIIVGAITLFLAYVLISLSSAPQQVTPCLIYDKIYTPPPLFSTVYTVRRMRAPKFIINPIIISAVTEFLFFTITTIPLGST